MTTAETATSRQATSARAARTTCDCQNRIPKTVFDTLLLAMSLLDSPSLNTVFHPTESASLPSKAYVLSFCSTSFQESNSEPFCCQLRLYRSELGKLRTEDLVTYFQSVAYTLWMLPYVRRGGVTRRGGHTIKRLMSVRSPPKGQLNGRSLRPLFAVIFTRFPYPSALV